MTKNICIKMLILFFAVTVFLNTFCFQEVRAVGDMLQAGQDFLGKGQGTSTVIDETALSDVSDKIYNLLLSIAIIIAVIVAMILGIQFMVASADEKAKVKEAIMPFVVGCVVVFGSFTVWKVAVNIGNEAVGPIADAVDTSGTVDEQRNENHEQYEKIENGEIASFSNKEVKDAYTTNYVSDDLAKWTKTEADPRSGGHAVEGVDYGLTLDEAIQKLSSVKKVIYNEAKERGLLAEDGIYLKK